jgi:hypothetical protein
VVKVLRDLFDEEDEPTLDHRGRPVGGDPMKS